MSEAYIYDALRTPLGRGDSRGALYEVKPVDLLGAALQALHRRNALATARFDDVLIGCVAPVDDQGNNLAKAALLHAGWPASVSGMQLNRFGASGLEAVNLAAMKVRSGWERLVVAGGLECPSRVPMELDGGALVYDPELINGIRYLPMGVAADLVATLEGFSREELDGYALRSQQRAGAARAQGRFQGAVTPIYDRNGLLLLSEDECPRPDLTAETLAALPPAYAGLGAQGFDALALQACPHISGVRHLHTEGNSYVPVDGAALLLIGDREQRQVLDRPPRARIAAAATVSTDPTQMLGGAGPAALLALERAGMQPADIDLWECNETFAAVALKFQRDLGIEDDRFNVNGGAIALGHAPGASGSVLLGTLLDELEHRDLQTGLAALAGAGGLGVATIVVRSA